MRTDAPPTPPIPPTPREDAAGNAGESPLLDGLTKPQREAVLHTEGPLLVLAGPGSGKTRVITRRIAYLISCGIPAWQILALTFTNKAAGEMRERVAHLLGEGPVSRGLTVTTFHALCARLLRRYADVSGLPGLKPDFAIFDSADQLALMKKTIADLDLSTSNFPPRSVLTRISNAKNELLDAAAFAGQATDFSMRAVARIYAAYERALRRAGGVDFDDLLLLTAQMLKHNAEVRQECQRRWQYLLIDEYQDTNRAQLVIATLLAGPGQGDGEARSRPNICVVGDPDQSIYAWRGADISNILQFEQQYPGAAVITLGENFRSTRAIVAAADALIRHNTQRKHKDLFTSRAEGEKVEVVLTRDEHHEARLVADWLRERKMGRGPSEEGGAWKDMAVFYRTNALSRVMEDQLRNEGIPYIIARGTAFYQREEIKHAVAYLRVVANPADSVSLGRIINTPARGIGEATWDRVEAAATARDVGGMEALRLAAASTPGFPDLTTRAANAIRKFIDTVDGWTGSGTFMGSDTPASLSELVERIVRESGLEQMYKAGKTETDEDRLENLAELVSSAAEFEQEYDPSEDPAAASPGGGAAPMPPLLAILRAYLERITLVADADTVDPAQGAVTLMTLHAAKGLEFRHVAMLGLEEGCLPHARANENPADLEEERRLCFVGITRAMERLVMTSARYRTVRGVGERTIPSRFLEELPDALVTFSDQADAGDWGSPGELDRPGGARPGTPARSREPALPIGSLVRHPQFGLGRVEAVTGGANARAQIAFRDAGRKTIVLEYARLQVVSAQ